MYRRGLHRRRIRGYSKEEKGKFSNFMIQYFFSGFLHCSFILFDRSTIHIVSVLKRSTWNIFQMGYSAREFVIWHRYDPGWDPALSSAWRKPSSHWNIRTGSNYVRIAEIYSPQMISARWRAYLDQSEASRRGVRGGRRPLNNLDFRVYCKL